jgi:hypothetical protein
MNVRHRVNELRSYNESGEEPFLKNDGRDEEPQPTVVDESDPEDADTSNVSPASSRWRRLAIIFLCALVVLFAFLMRINSNKRPETLYASRFVSRSDSFAVPFTHNPIGIRENSNFAPLRAQSSPKHLRMAECDCEGPHLRRRPSRGSPRPQRKRGRRRQVLGSRSEKQSRIGGRWALSGKSHLTDACVFC